MLRTPARAHGFGLVEMTIIVIVIGVTALFAIPRYEARGEKPVVRSAFRYGMYVERIQAARIREQGSYEPVMEQLEVADGVPPEFHVADWTVDPEVGWLMRLERHNDDSPFGAYTLCFSDQGFHLAESTVPIALVPSQWRGD